MSVDLAPTDFRFLRPLWLFGLLAIPALLWWLRRLRQRRDVWRDAVDAHLLSHLLQGAQTTRAGWRSIAPVLAWTLAILALAGPSWRELPQPLWQDRNPLVIVLDLSYATLTADVQPTRLLQARAKIAHILQTRGGGQIALVAFADDAYTVSPLTDDADNVALFLDALNPDVMPRDGSRADRAIEEAMRLLRRAGFKRGDILLITDHAGGAADSAAIDARKIGYRVSVLGMGAPAGGAYRDAKDLVRSARLDADGLRKLASSGGGAYATVMPGDEDLRSLGVLEADRIDAAAAQGKRGNAPLDEGFWLLPALMLLALLAFRRGVLAVALLALFLPWQPPAFAAESSLWQRQDQRQYTQMRRGVEAYRSGDYAAAEAALRDLPGADAAYNRGNALAKQGRYEEAIAEYDRALKLQPSMRDAQVNRERVEEAARKPPQDPSRKPQQKPKDKPKDPAQDKPDDSAKDKPQDKPGDPAKDKPQDKPDDSAKDKPQDNPGDPAKDKPKDPAQGKPQDQQNGGQPNPPPPQKPPQQKPPQQNQDPAERKAQEQAQREAEQRERMRRAQQKPSEQKGPGEAPDKPPQPLYPASRGPAPANESAQARERRIANEVWLQRVPDDPGGLLRAKFKLENQRRRRGKDR